MIRCQLSLQLVFNISTHFYFVTKSVYNRRWLWERNALKIGSNCHKVSDRCKSLDEKDSRKSHTEIENVLQLSLKSVRNIVRRYKTIRSVVKATICETALGDFLRIGVPQQKKKISASVKIWDTMSFKKIRKLNLIEGTEDTNKYLNILWICLTSQNSK